MRKTFLLIALMCLTIEFFCQNPAHLDFVLNEIFEVQKQGDFRGLTIGESFKKAEQNENKNIKTKEKWWGWLTFYSRKNWFIENTEYGISAYWEYQNENNEFEDTGIINGFRFAIIFKDENIFDDVYYKLLSYFKSKYNIQELKSDNKINYKGRKINFCIGVDPEADMIIDVQFSINYTACYVIE
jgi:hypothetical protein